METVEKIGIMGGTFNPIHNGHLMLAQCAYRQFHLDRILVIPNRLPVYKESKELLAPDLRSEMIRLAIKDYPYMRFRILNLSEAVRPIRLIRYGNFTGYIRMLGFILLSAGIL